MSEAGVCEHLWNLLRWNDDDHAFAIELYRAKSRGRLPDHVVQRLLSIISSGVSEDQISRLRASIGKDTSDLETTITYLSLWSDKAPVLSASQVKAAYTFVEEGQLDHMISDVTERVAASHGVIALINSIDGVLSRYKTPVANLVDEHPEVIRFFVDNSDRVLDIHVYVHELNLKVTNSDHFAELPRLLQLSSPLSPGAL